MMKEGWFLHRRVSVDDQGWREEIGKKYIEDMVKAGGVEDGNVLSTPGYKDTKIKVKDCRLTRPLTQATGQSAGQHSTLQIVEVTFRSLLKKFCESLTLRRCRTRSRRRGFAGT